MIPTTPSVSDRSWLALAAGLVLASTLTLTKGAASAQTDSQQYDLVVVRGAVTNVPVLRVGGNAAQPDSSGNVRSSGAFAFREGACEGAYNVFFTYPDPRTNRRQTTPGRITVRRAFLNGRRTTCPFRQLARTGIVHTEASGAARDLGRPRCAVVRMRRGDRSIRSRYRFAFQGLVEASPNFFDMRRWSLTLVLRAGRLRSVVTLTGSIAFRGANGPYSQHCL